jgi:hypothetical protein
MQFVPGSRLIFWLISVLSLQTHLCAALKNFLIPVMELSAHDGHGDVSNSTIRCECNSTGAGSIPWMCLKHSLLFPNHRKKCLRDSANLIHKSRSLTRTIMPQPLAPRPSVPARPTPHSTLPQGGRGSARTATSSGTLASSPASQTFPSTPPTATLIPRELAPHVRERWPRDRC